MTTGSLSLSPTSLNAFLACEHRAWLDLQLAQGEIELHAAPRPDAELIAERGRRHEEEFHQGLELDREVTAIRSDSLEGAARMTDAAMRRGDDVIYQGAFAAPDGWRGYADFLLRTQDPSDLGGWSYEVYDTKLAAHPKPYFVLQLAFYTEQVGRIQGRLPRAMHVVLGTNEVATLRYTDFAAYVRRVRASFLAYLAAPPPPPYPYPVEHCDYCHWWSRCRDKRVADDHLSLVAGLSRSQSMKLEASGIATMEGLARTPEALEVPRLSPRTLRDLRLQANLQVHTRETGELIREFLPLEEGRGFFRLPEPSAGDVFFDIEGDPYWGKEGLEYLLGSWTSDGAYRPFWAHNLTEERRSFEAWTDWIHGLLADDPSMHVYHYNHYETTALKRLMSRHGTREDALDELLRREVFVDLFAVVRQAMRVGQPSYGLKHIEEFYDYQRDAEVTAAGGSILAYEEYIAGQDASLLAAIEAYNRDDCISTSALRDWLLDERDQAATLTAAVLPNRESVPAIEQSDEARQWLHELHEFQEALSPDGAEDLDDLQAEERSRVLLADLLLYHRREAKPAWWAYFTRLRMSSAELIEDPDAIGGLDKATDVEARDEKRSWLHPLRFPPQQHKLSAGRAVDPESTSWVNIAEIDEAEGILWLKRGKQSKEVRFPTALVPGRPLDDYAHQRALRRLAERVVRHGLEPIGDLDASCDLLLGAIPRLAGEPTGQALHGAEVDLAVLVDQILQLQDSALFVQGPPGSGKTWTGARLIVDLMTRGKTVGVSSNSHHAIHNLLDEIESVAQHQNLDFVGLKKSSGDNLESEYTSRHITSTTRNDRFPPGPELQLVAGTGWLFARDDLARSVDYLFVDEAGQLALADALAMSQAARNVVLLGDPQQLAHVSQGTHPRDSGVSVLQHLLKDAPTVAPDRGVFLSQTYRMHPRVCQFVSEVMYEGRLRSDPSCEQRSVDSGPFSKAGVHLLAVEHTGNRQSSPEEAQVVARYVAGLLNGRVGCPNDGSRPISLRDILVVAPYNAQVRCLLEHLPPGARVGTVDKFQGQEAPIVFYSMASSTGDDVPRGMEFLFSRNRLNVAVSRAQSVAAVVCSPRLLTTPCRTIEQMRLVNVLCRFGEICEEQRQADEGARV